MRSKNSRTLTDQERAHLERVRSLSCSVCDKPGPSSAHHIRQGLHFATVALCWDCHQSEHFGWHGRRVNWKIRKVDELDALAVTLAALMSAR